VSLNAKDVFRKLCLKKLQFFSKTAKIEKDKYICSQILQIIGLQKAKKILFYIPLSIEVDVEPLIKKLRKRKNIEIYVPFMKGKSFVPVKYRLPLKKKRFGIREPNYSIFRNNSIKFDIIVVPIIGIDETYRRVGFGAGMYDRFFENLKKNQSSYPLPTIIFTQLKLCKSTNIITSMHDIRADYIITR
jgi:5-formyltetrahydrofolate cyclo-ligase